MYYMTFNFKQIKGVIFDFDDTMIDNGPLDNPSEWLHARSRLRAVHEIAKEHGLSTLLSLTVEENNLAFTTAKVHSIQGAVWNIFFMKGLVDTDDIDTSHALYPIIEEIAGRKNILHEPLLRKYGVEVPGVSDFIKNLGENGLSKTLAIATTALGSEVKIFIEKYGLSYLFPPDRIISAEKLTRPKPDPESYNLAFRSLELPESDRRYVVAFEDNPRGIRSAKSAGLYVCAITTRTDRDNPALIASGPDLIAGSYSEFEKLLNVPW